MTLSFDPDKLELPFYHFIVGERVDPADVLEILATFRPPLLSRSGMRTSVDEDRKTSIRRRKMRRSVHGAGNRDDRRQGQD